MVTLALGVDPDLMWLLHARLLSVPLALLREFGRTCAFTRLQAADALLLDSSVAALRLGALPWLRWTSRMSFIVIPSTVGSAPTAGFRFIGEHGASENPRPRNSVGSVAAISHPFPSLGMLGAPYRVLIGNVATTVGRWIASDADVTRSR